MKKLYYTIWVDAIQKANSPKNTNRDMWKFYTMIGISMAMAVNLALFMSILQRNILGHYFYDFKITSLEGTRTGSFLSFFILFILPPLILNYMLIFRNNRYEKLIKKYKYHNGKLFFAYFIGSLFLPLILIFGGYLIGKL